MRHFAQRMLTTLPLSALALSSIAQTQERPNIIFFLVDDMGWQETSVPFYKERTPLNNRYRTPNMERLAQRGVKFMEAYSCPVSSPSRCSLLSGMNAARHQVTNWIEGGNQNTNAGGGDITLPVWNWNGVQPESATSTRNCQRITALPQVLKDNGYYTIHCGKANFGATGTPGSNPTAYGFDVNIAGSSYGSPGSYLAADNYGSSANHVYGLDEYAKQGIFLTEALTLEAKKQLDQRPKDQPFYLYFSHYAIHTPYNPDTRFTANYMDGTQGKYDELLGARLNTSEINHAALIEGMDKSLGDMMDYLDANGLTDNTIILFMSDNGGQGISPRQGTLNRLQNYPARGGKGSAYEGGVHEPMIVSWPGVTANAAETYAPVMIEDFYPTILEMAGVSNYETVQTIDGHSFADIVRNPATEDHERAIVWHYPNRWGESQDKAEGYGSWSAILKDGYHLIYFWENQERRLYNIKEDIGEQHNLAAEQPELCMALAQELTDSLVNYGAGRPKLNGKEVPWPVDGQEIVPKELPIKSGQSYTIQPYQAPDKYLFAVSAAAWGTSDGKQKVQYTSEPTQENGAYWTFTTGASDNSFNIRPTDSSFASGLWLNPRGGGYVGTWTASGGDSSWTIVEVDDMPGVYTLHSSKNGQSYFQYRADDPYVLYSTSATTDESNWFYIRDIDAEPIDPDATPSYAKYLPKLTEDECEPIWYYIKSAKHGGYWSVAGAKSYLPIVESTEEASRFYFTGKVDTDDQGHRCYKEVKIHTDYAGLEGMGLNGRNSWAEQPSKPWMFQGVKYGEYEGVTIYNPNGSNNILAWSDTNSLCSGTHVDYKSDSSDNTDESRPWIFVQYVEPEPPHVLKAEDVDAQKAYIIYTAARGGLTVIDEDADCIMGTEENGMGIPVSKRDPLQHFAFINYLDDLFLYNIATQKFVSSTNKGALVAMPSDPVYFTDADDSTVRLIFSDAMNFNLGGSKQITIDSWTTKDAGNSFIIVEAADFDPSTVLSEIVGINTVLSPAASEARFYDLFGRPASNDTRGVFVRGRKKIIK